VPTIGRESDWHAPAKRQASATEDAARIRNIMGLMLRVLNDTNERRGRGE